MLLLKKLKINGRVTRDFQHEVGSTIIESMKITDLVSSLTRKVEKRCQLL